MLLRFETRNSRHSNVWSHNTSPRQLDNHQPNGTIKEKAKKIEHNSRINERSNGIDARVHNTLPKRKWNEWKQRKISDFHLQYLMKCNFVLENWNQCIVLCWLMLTHTPLVWHIIVFMFTNILLLEQSSRWQTHTYFIQNSTMNCWRSAKGTPLHLIWLGKSTFSYQCVRN